MYVCICMYMYVFIYIYMYIHISIHRDSIVQSFQREPSIPKQLNTNVIRGLVKQ